MEKTALAISGIFVSVVLIAVFVMMIIGRVSGTIFWIVVIIAAIYAYKVLPKLNK